MTVLRSLLRKLFRRKPKDDASIYPMF